MKRLTPILAPFLILAASGLLAGQEARTMSLQDCIDYTLENAVAVRKATLEGRKTEYRIKELTSAGLPRIDLTGDIRYNFANPVFIAPGGLFGEPDRDVGIRFGKAIQTGLGLYVEQTLFDKGLSTGREGREKLGDLQELLVQKSKEEAALEVAKVYLQALIVEEKRGLLTANLLQVEGLLQLTERQYQQGFAKEIDVKRLRVAQKNLATKLQNLDLQYGQLLELLKYRMSMPLDEPITLQDSLTDQEFTLPELDAQAPLENRSELALLNLQNDLNQVNLLRLEAGKWPTLSFVGGLNLVAWGDNFNDWTSTNYWYADSFLGLRLKYSIFDGFERQAKVEQTRVGIEQWQEDLRFTQQSLQLQYNNTREKLRISYNELQSLRENREVAEEVYEITRKRYAEGVAPIMELLSTETAMQEAQTNYLTTLLEVKLAELELKHAKGELLK